MINIKNVTEISGIKDYLIIHKKTKIVSENNTILYNVNINNPKYNRVIILS